MRRFIHRIRVFKVRLVERAVVRPVLAESTTTSSGTSSSVSRTSFFLRRFLRSGNDGFKSFYRPSPPREAFIIHHGAGRGRRRLQRECKHVRARVIIYQTRICVRVFLRLSTERRKQQKRAKCRERDTMGEILMISRWIIFLWCFCGVKISLKFFKRETLR